MGVLSIPIFYMWENTKNAVQESEIQTEMAYIAQSIIELYKSNKNVDLSQYSSKYDITIKKIFPPGVPENIEELDVTLRLKAHDSLYFRLVTYIRK